jgi:hypothetical protein
MGIPPLAGEPFLRDHPIPDEFVAEKLDTEQNQQPTTERKDRGHLSNFPTISRVNKKGKYNGIKRTPGSGIGHGNTAAARGTPPTAMHGNHRRQRPEGVPKQDKKTQACLILKPT